MIRMGNFLGNPGDYILFKISYAHLGLTGDERFD
jgi:hypothetical protein